MTFSLSPRTRRRLERGGVATLVAVFLGMGVLLGMAALTLDVGSIWTERRQLQNGADAASQALAKACANTAGTCPASATSVVATYGNANTKDGTTSNDGVCAYFAGGATVSGWTTCASATDNLATQNSKAANLGECPPLPAWLKTAIAGGKTSYVEVKVGTANTGTTASPLKGIFSKAVTGQDNPHVSACSRTAWGPGKGASLMPLTFSECEWKASTVNGTVYGVEVALPLKYKNNVPTGCNNYKGHDYNGGFGWIVHPTGTCKITFVAGSWVEAETGVGAGNDCFPTISVNQVVYLPVFDCVNKLKVICPNDAFNPTTYYHIAGLAAFQVTAIDLTSQTIGTPGTTAKAECQAESLDNKCLYGKFLKALAPVGTIDPNGSATDYGIQISQPAG